MPRGIPNKKAEPKAVETKQETISEEKPKVHISPAEMKAMEAKAHLRDKPSNEERSAVKAQPGMKFFMAPDGTRLEGEADKNRLWYRNLHGNNKGGWILPER
jgi:hypothetical protein